MNLKSKLENNASEVSEHISSLLKGQETILESMRYSALSGGKYLRSFMLREFSRNLHLNEKETLDIAAAIEIAHTYSLVHDDLPAMDNASLRRNKKTCHLAFDEATAILAGDALLSLSFEIIANCPISDPESKLQVIKELAIATGYSGMIEGQLLDIRAQNNMLDLPSLRKIHYLKTGKIFRFCAVSPFILSGNISLIPLAENFALNFGLLFQIIDDILDFSGKSSETGKDNNKDLTLNKINYVSLLGPGESHTEAEKHASKAIAVLNKMPFDTSIMQELVKFNISRKN